MNVVAPPLLTDVIQGAVRELQMLALITREVASRKNLKLSLTDLIIFRERGFRAMPYFLQNAQARVASEKQLAAELQLELHNAALQAFDGAMQLMNQYGFSPITRRPQVAAAITQKVCFSVTKFATNLNVSQDTADRWLNALVNANILRKLPIGNKHFYINTFHFAALQQMLFPLGEIRLPVDRFQLHLQPRADLDKEIPPF